METLRRLEASCCVLNKICQTHRDGADGVVVCQADDLRVIAFTVDHGDVVKPAYGYCIEHRSRVAVISGDTRYNENVVRCGQGPTC
jgi:ribonuclease Z